jgi:hypothetical protein
VLGRGTAKLLVDVDLWEVAEDGWQIHDFDDYLPTAETSSARSEAGKKGANARWGKKNKPSDDSLPSEDGNLPSGDMATDGTRMAGNGGTAPLHAENRDEDLPDDRSHDADGKLPSSDDSLPSEDGKPLASDGSRAPARRAISKEIAPEPGSQTQTRKTKDIVPAKPPRDDAERLCAHLANRIEANGSKRPTITAKWLDAARLMIDLDGRTEEQAHTAIDWCQDDEFWRSNVMSMPTLREKYDQLRLQAIREKSPPPGNRRQQERAGALTRAMERARAKDALEVAR